MPNEFRGRITIDGKGTFEYVLTPVGAEGSVPAAGIPAQPVNIPPDVQRQVSVSDGDVATVMLLKHEMKSGIVGPGKKRAGEIWVKHSFRGSDNRWYTSFDEKIVSQLSPLVGAGTPVKIVAKANAFKGFDITRVLGA